MDDVFESLTKEVKIIQSRDPHFKGRRHVHDSYFYTDLYKEELKNTDDSIVVIFDDNISGGATFSDICYQLQKIGVKYMIPITFGKMRTSYSQGIGQVINKPENGFNY